MWEVTAVADLDIVTGAFSFTGRALAHGLLERGRRVRTLTRHTDPTRQLAGRVEVASLRFDDPAALANSLRGASTLYNTYWIRFEYGRSTFARAIENTRSLLQAARRAGIQRVVHMSVTSPSLDSPLPYFRAKAVLEQDVAASGLRFTIVRPTLIFGSEDILVNNIAWILRTFPLFLVPGDGRYRLQPVSVDDVAAIALDAAESGGDRTLDAAGPETYAFAELVSMVAGAVGSRSRVIHAPPRIALGLVRLVGRARRDVLLTADELDGLMASLLVSDEPPRGRASFSRWLAENGGGLGRTYTSELARNYGYAAL